MTTKWVPYDDTPIGECASVGIRILLPTGAEMYVGLHDDRIGHVFYNTQPDGRRTRLRFALSPEACCSLAHLYAGLGLLGEQMQQAEVELIRADRAALEDKS